MQVFRKTLRIAKLLWSIEDGPIKEEKVAYAEKPVGLDNKYELERLRLLIKFSKLLGKEKEIELEWQRIQQDEHDFKYAFQASVGEETQAKYLYKKGIADGVKWCINRFC